MLLVVDIENVTTSSDITAFLFSYKPPPPLFPSILPFSTLSMHTHISLSIPSLHTHPHTTPTPPHTLSPCTHHPPAAINRINNIIASPLPLMGHAPAPPPLLPVAPMFPGTTGHHPPGGAGHLPGGVSACMWVEGGRCGVYCSLLPKLALAEKRAW